MLPNWQKKRFNNICLPKKELTEKNPMTIFFFRHYLQWKGQSNIASFRFKSSDNSVESMKGMVQLIPAVTVPISCNFSGNCRLLL